MRETELYYELYPLLKKARAFATAHAQAQGANAQLLAGLCATASAYLSQELFRRGLVHRLAVAERAVTRMDQEAHVYVLCGQHVVDVTASQFGHADLVVLPRAQAQKSWYWRATRTFDCPLRLHAWQRETKWPAWQVVPHQHALAWKREREGLSGFSCGTR